MPSKPDKRAKPAKKHSEPSAPQNLGVSQTLSTGEDKPNPQPSDKQKERPVIMAAPNLKDLLSQPTDKFVRPPAYPAGWWSGEILSHSFGKSTQKKTDFIEFLYKLGAPGDDITEDMLEGIDLTEEKKIGQKLYITPKSLYRLSEYLDAVLGEEAGKGFDERLPDTRGVSVLVLLTKKESDNEEGVFYNEVVKVMKA